MAFADVPAWLAASIIPLSFLLIAVRYLLLFITPSLQQPVKHDEQ
jgi:hypothetical protein